MNNTINTGAWVGEGSYGEVRRTPPLDLNPEALEFAESPAAVTEGKLGDLRSLMGKISVNPEELGGFDSGYEELGQASSAKPIYNSRNITKEQDYRILEFAFYNAVQETLRTSGLDNPKQLVNNGQIVGMDTAHTLLANFRDQLLT